MQTGQTLVLGGSPNRVEQEQKILVAVSNWTCTSRPMTGSYLARGATELSGVVNILSDYSGQPVQEEQAGVLKDRCNSPVQWDEATDGINRAHCTPGFGAGALKYFSIGISKYINSEPEPSLTPVT
jgi:hypothetical protein